MSDNTSRQPERSAAASVPDRLWAVPIYLPYLQPALTDRGVEQAEAKLGVRLPRAYLAALRVHVNVGDVWLALASCLAIVEAIKPVSVSTERDQSINAYRQFRATLPGEHQSAWLTANRTRRGFVREDDPEYKALREQFTELVDRYPEHSDCGYFLSCSDFDSRAGQAIARSLTKLPFAARALPADTR